MSAAIRSRSSLRRTKRTARQGIGVFVYSKVKALPLSPARTRLVVRRAVSVSGRQRLAQKLTIGVVFTTDAEIRKLNSKWRKKHKATDVLSFSMLENIRSNEPSCAMLGEIVISVQTARRQAKELGISVTKRLEQLLVHGTLHLLGFDHEGVPMQTAQRMFTLEDKILRGWRSR